MTTRGFTLIETMVAIALLAVAIVAPVSLAARSLQSAYYARDQVTASYLAQEAIESVRAIRDHNIMRIRQGSSVDILDGIPIGQDFVIDTRSNQTWTNCATLPLKTDGSFYGYGADPCNQGEAGWTPARFSRVVRADFITGTTDEIRLTATVSWASGVFAGRSFAISENLYRWVPSDNI